MLSRRSQVKEDMEDLDLGMDKKKKVWRGPWAACASSASWPSLCVSVPCHCPSLTRPRIRRTREQKSKKPKDEDDSAAKSGETWLADGGRA